MNLNTDNLCHDWLNKKSASISSLTYDKYESIINKYIISFFQTHPIEDMNEKVIEEYLTIEYESGTSLSIIKTIRYIIRSIYSEAKNRYQLASIDFTRINTFYSSENKRIINDSELEIIRQFCHDNINPFGLSICLALYGLRISEICALKYRNIDLESKYIEITSKTERIKNRTSQSSHTTLAVSEVSFPVKRRIELTDEMIEYLDRYLQYRKNDNADRFILNNKLTAPDPRAFQLKLKRLAKSEGFTVTYSMLRNTCVHNCLKYNVNIKTIMNMLGVLQIEIKLEDVCDL